MSLANPTARDISKKVCVSRCQENVWYLQCPLPNILPVSALHQTPPLILVSFPFILPRYSEGGGCDTAGAWGHASFPRMTAVDWVGLCVCFAVGVLQVLVRSGPLWRAEGEESSSSAFILGVSSSFTEKLSLDNSEKNSVCVLISEFLQGS